MIESQGGGASLTGEPIEKPSFAKRAYIVFYLVGLLCLGASNILDTSRLVHRLLGFGGVILIAVGLVFFVREARARKRYRLTGRVD
jgi:cytochrome c biogenesis protein CcdA